MVGVAVRIYPTREIDTVDIKRDDIRETYHSENVKNLSRDRLTSP